MIVAYPLNDTLYTAEDAQTYMATRSSGVYSADDDFAIRLWETYPRDLLVSPGLAWMSPSKFKGFSVASKETETVIIADADETTDRTDLIVLEYDARTNACQIKAIKGESTDIPKPVKNEITYQLGLYAVNVPAGSTQIRTSDIIDLRSDPEYCGIMYDAVSPASPLPLAFIKSADLKIATKTFAATYIKNNNTAILYFDTGYLAMGEGGGGTIYLPNELANYTSISGIGGTWNTGVFDKNFVTIANETKDAFVLYDGMADVSVGLGGRAIGHCILQY